jgi:hypothetical protein
MVNVNFIGVGQAALALKTINKDAYIASLTREASGAIVNGKVDKFYDEFKRMDHSKLLAPDDIEKFRKQVEGSLSTDVKIYSDEQRKQELDFDKKQKEITDNFNMQLVSGNLSQEDLNSKLASNEIGLSTFKEYSTLISSSGGIIEDPAKKLWIQSHVLDVTEDDILTAPFLTFASRFELIKQRRAEESDASNWLSSQTGRVARDAIKRHFGMYENTIISRIDFDNKIGKDFNKMYDEFYAQVEALPLEQKAPKSLSIAQKLIKEYEEQQKLDKQLKAEKRAIKKKEPTDKEDSILDSFLDIIKSKRPGEKSPWDGYQ